MQEVYRWIELAGTSTAPVLIYGESGTGKELVARDRPQPAARAATSRSSPSTAPRFAETLLESELFGHERGAFTGADRAAARAASSWPTAARCSSTRSARCRSEPQVKLLRVLRGGRVRPGRRRQRAIQVDVRVIAATNRDLDRGDRRRASSARTCSTGSTCSRSTLPPLRERRRGHPAAGRHFLERVPGRTTARSRTRPRDAEQALRALPLARQRPRAAQRHPARGGPQRHRQDRRRAPARQRAASRRDRRRRPEPAGSRPSARWSAT